MIDVVFASPQFDDLRTQLLRSEKESAAVLLTTETARSNGARLLVREVHYVSGEQLDYQTPTGIQISAVQVAYFSRLARESGSGLIFVHTHPGGITDDFSNVDDRGEQLLREFLDRRNPGRTHIALLLTERASRARLLGRSTWVRVLQVGREVLDLTERSVSEIDSKSNERFDRQIRVFGRLAQQRLQRFRVAIVGLGGIGSLVAQQLAYLGVSDILLIDPDTIDLSNLNRLVGAHLSDIGLLKIEAAARNYLAIRPEALVQRSATSVLTESGARQLLEADFIFACTDSHGSRAVINQLSYQYLIPAIDTGVTIAVRGSVVTHVAGRVQMLAPRLGCLTCSELLDSDAVRRDLMSDFERQQDPYFTGPGAPQPAVLSINSTVASLAVTMFLSAVASVPVEPRFQMYNAIAGTVRAVKRDPVAACVVCSPRGALARGDEWPLPTRQA